MYRLILFLALSFSANSQITPYQPYPDGIAFWSYQHTTFNGQSVNQWYKDVIQHGDTTIANQTYNKRYIYNTYAGGTRQNVNSQEVFYLGLDDIEHNVTMPHSPAVGDTIALDNNYYLMYAFDAFNSTNHVDSFIVTNVDSLRLVTWGIQPHYSPEYHVRYSLDGIPFSNTNAVFGTTYIEGVGFDGWGGFEWRVDLSCFGVDGTLTHGDSINSQCITAEIYESSGLVVDIYPNPSSDRINIQSNGNLTDVTIVDMLGNVVFNMHSLPTSNYSIDVSEFSNGLYHLQISDGRFVKSEKIVIQR